MRTTISHLRDSVDSFSSRLSEKFHLVAHFTGHMKFLLKFYTFQALILQEII